MDANPQIGIDPIEQFLARDRRGHCQYFASALAMMLRSVDVPCRVVVGYRTEEYNGMTQYYIARQQHAHAWVEALVPASDIPRNVVVAGQPRTSRYWMRLDPTPGTNHSDQTSDGGVEKMIDLATNLWEDYVVEMDSDRQSDGLMNAAGLDGVRSSYQGFFQSVERFFGRADRKVSDIEPWDSEDANPWSWIFAGLVLVSIALILIRAFRVRASRFVGGQPDTLPAIDYYAEALRILRHAGIRRNQSETPRELLRRIGDQHPSLAVLTDSFERQRYGDGGHESEGVIHQALVQLRTSAARRESEN